MEIILLPIVIFIISFVFSMLGMGGAQLYIPILFFLGADLKRVAIPLGLFLNLLTTTSASVTYARNKLIDWGAFLAFSVPMIVMAPLGALFNFKLRGAYVLISLALFTIIAALFTLSNYRPKKLPEGWARLGIIGLSAAVLGFMTGLIGRGGGSFIVPILIALGLEPKRASATSSAIVTLSALSGLISHLRLQAEISWLWLYTALAVLLGATLGSNFMVKKMSGKGVKRLFGYVLLIIGLILLGMGIKELLMK